MMPIFSLFLGTQARDRDAFVHAVAHRCASQVSRKLRANTHAMSVAELRGYVRSQAAHAVRTHVLQDVTTQPTQSAPVDDLVAAALERTIHLVIQPILAPPVAAVPTPHVRLRTAA